MHACGADADSPTLDAASSTLLERLVFDHRPKVLIAGAALTALFAGRLPDLVVSTSFEATLPQRHPYIRNYLDNAAELRGLGDSVRIVVERTNGDIFDRGYLAALQEINDAVFLLPGVDRAWMKSLWTPVVRWTEVTEEGFVGGPVMPQAYDGSAESIEALRLNIGRAGVIGSLVANDYRSSAIVVPLLARSGDGAPLDYHGLATSLEGIRQRHEAHSGARPELESDTADRSPAVRVHVIGYAKLVGDLIDGLRRVAGFFVGAAAIAAAILFGYTRCWRSTALVLACSLNAVVWQLGLIAMLGQTLNPFSVLVPFLVFAIGVSHGTQKLNGITHDIQRGASRLAAARTTFRRLFAVGVTALLADAVGFAALMLIDIPMIRELALSASLGVIALVFTNLVLLPVLLSYIGVSVVAARRRAPLVTARPDRFAETLAKLTRRPWAAATVVSAAALGLAAFAVSLRLQIGDLDPGSPELRPDSRYNLDNAYIASHYGVSSDAFAVMVRTPKDQCGTHENLIEADRLAWTLAQLPGVQRVESLADTVRAYTAGSFDGNPKWHTVSSDQRIIDAQVNNAMSWNSGLVTPACSVLPVVAYLSDHKAATLASVVAAAKGFATTHDSSERQFLLAAGNAGIEAATNVVVEQANARILACVYGAVVLLCFITFRSWRAVVVATLPLLLTSIMAEALMVCLGIGLKVSTLPVVALGVGIGVDYALYMVSVQLALQRAGASLPDACRQAMGFVGKVVALVGVTLTAGVITWAWSPIKFQADMGILLTFMIVWNMLAALTLVPALSHFLLRDIGRATSNAMNPRQGDPR